MMAFLACSMTESGVVLGYVTMMDFWMSTAMTPLKSAKTAKTKAKSLMATLVWDAILVQIGR